MKPIFFCSTIGDNLESGFFSGFHFPFATLLVPVSLPARKYILILLLNR